MDSERYSRQLIFEPIGSRGQQALKASRVVLVGCGALGSNAANLMVRAGIGNLCIIDDDVVELSNLQRQNLFDEQDAAKATPKAEAAVSRLREINPEVTLESRTLRLSASNIEERLCGFDLIVDGTDNFEARYLINDVSIKHNIPWVYAACVKSQGRVMNILPGRTPCFRCVFDHPPEPGALERADTAGIIGTIPQVVSAIQVTEAIKILTGQYDALCYDLLGIDLWSNRFQRIDLAGHRQRVNCPACGQHRFEFLEGR